MFRSFGLCRIRAPILLRRPCVSTTSSAAALQLQQQEKLQESAQRKALHDFSLCWCSVCHRDVSTNRDNNMMIDFFSILEHHSNVHVMEQGSERILPSLLAKTVNNNRIIRSSSSSSSSRLEQEQEQEDENEFESQQEQDGEYQKEAEAEEEQQQQEEEVLRQSNRDRLDFMFDSSKNAELITKSIINALESNNHNNNNNNHEKKKKKQQQQAKEHIHLLLAQDGADHDVESLRIRLQKHLSRLRQTQSSSRDEKNPTNHHHQRPLIRVFAVFFTSQWKSQHLSEFVINHLHHNHLQLENNEKSTPATADVVDSRFFNNNNDDALMELRTCLLLPNSRSVERTVYFIIEILSVLTTALANRRNFLRKQKRRKEEEHEEQQQLSVSLLTDHQHLFQNVETLFGKCPDYKLSRVK